MVNIDGKKLYELSDIDINTLYNAGPEQTISFIRFLIDVIKGIDEKSKKQEDRIKNLEKIIAKDSHNSSKPPSTDGYKKVRKPIKNLRKKSKKKSGGQKGHPDTKLKLEDNPDSVETIPVTSCDRCGGTHIKKTGYKRHQVIEVEIQKVTKEYRTETGECCNCGNVIITKFPDKINQDVQYGSNVKSIITYMRNLNYIPLKRLSEMFEAVFKIPLSEGTIVNTTRKVSSILEPFDDDVINKLLSSAVICVDETGIRVNNSLHWLHSASNSLYTFYFVHKKRGKNAIDEMNILPRYKGTAIHDSWPCYFKYMCSHGLCNSHHLRELIFLYEEMNQKWAKKMMELLLEIKEKSDKAKLKEKTIPIKTMIYYEALFKQIIYKGIKENPQVENIKRTRGRKKKGKALCLLERFKTRLHQVLAFMYDILIPFDNNQAERDIRMAKLYQKISGCFRTREGAKDFFRIRSYISTLRKHKIDIISSLKNLFEVGQYSPFMAE